MKQGLLWLLSAYKRWISPSLPHACRFVPTCSEYAMEAVDRHGAFHGSLLAAWRVLRCNPFARSGYDPVPQKAEWRLRVCKSLGEEGFASGRDLGGAERRKHEFAELKF